MDEICESAGLVISAEARFVGTNNRLKKHYLVGDRWFDMADLPVADCVDAVRRAKLDAIPIGIYDNI